MCVPVWQPIAKASLAPEMLAAWPGTTCRRSPCLLVRLYMKGGWPGKRGTPMVRGWPSWITSAPRR